MEIEKAVIPTKREEKIAYWKKQSKAWKTSGLTQGEFCRTRGLTLSTFVYWHTKGCMQKTIPNGNFVPLNISPPTEKAIRLRYPTGLSVELPLSVPFSYYQQLLSFLGGQHA